MQPPGTVAEAMKLTRNSRRGRLSFAITSAVLCSCWYQGLFLEGYCCKALCAPARCGAFINKHYYIIVIIMMIIIIILIIIIISSSSSIKILSAVSDEKSCS